MHGFTCSTVFKWAIIGDYNKQLDMCDIYMSLLCTE